MSTFSVQSSYNVSGSNPTPSSLFFKGLQYGTFEGLQ